MRRRKPKTVRLSQSDIHEIERLLEDGRTEQRIVRRGRVLLAMKNPKTLVSDLCQQVGMTRFGIWCICRRYEAVGLDAIYENLALVDLAQSQPCNVCRLNNLPVVILAASDWR